MMFLDVVCNWGHTEEYLETMNLHTYYKIKAGKIYLLPDYIDPENPQAGRPSQTSSSGRIHSIEALAALRVRQDPSLAGR